MKIQSILLIIGTFAASNVIAQTQTPAPLPKLDFGPFQMLIGTWKSNDKGGVDVAPGRKGSPVGQGGPAVEPFYEIITFEPAADAVNASQQDLVALYYSQEVFRKSNNTKFHDQRGYIIYDKKNKIAYNSFCIPRNTCVVAEGPVGDGKIIKFETKSNGVAESEFMVKNAATNSFVMTLNLTNPKQISYQQTTMLQIYGRPFPHTDSSILNKIK